MLITIPLLAIIISLLLAWSSKSARIWRFCWVNVVVMSVYDLIGGFYIISFFDEDGSRFGPVLILLFGTLLHIVLLFIAIIVMTMFRAVKDQGDDIKGTKING
ncbi:hypothetical protein [Mucilaginibacter sp. FT3.2]|uniref:hypothetical protein n=1 Tax=Mucilaginibacter sp. FT3.2 TaxID=2723090 RepID=UPI00160F6A61|nr:hypothetical protein [Mucilaginibacter sp. FT3.2]MBB6231143.1 putative membrane protein [Mucilaginibacter sp. FT3.2]